jgi:glyoxylase-like metal-dependent hydrolase (beta-lactamase superfamily II)
MAVRKGSFHFRIGNFNCIIISDGTFKAAGSPPAQLPGQYSLQPGHLIDGQCLYIKKDEHTILIDTGHGAGVQPGTGKLLQNLRAEGIKPSDIETIILTHAHGDHIGGNTDVEGRPVFPNARYFISEEEWKFWTSDPNLAQLDAGENVKQMFLGEIQKNLISVQDRIHLINDKTKIIPGIKFINAPGHTPGLIIPVISSDSQQLLCVSDLFHLTLEIEQRNVYSPFDIAPEQAEHTRAKIMSLAAKNNALVFASHLPFPGLGRIKQKDNAWLWQPVEIYEN